MNMLITGIVAGLACIVNPLLGLMIALAGYVLGRDGV